MLNWRLQSRCETKLKEKMAKLLSKHDEVVALEYEVKVRQKDVKNVKRALTSLSYQEGHMESLKKVRKGNAEVALSLVGYADEVKKAMEFVFGETSVCKTNAAAEKVAFDRQVKTRSDTLEGDLFQPGGLVTGGSVRKVQGIHAYRLNYSKESLAGCESYVYWMNNGHVIVQEPSKVKLDSGDVNNNDLSWNHLELSVMLEHMQAHVAPTNVDPGAGLQWHKGGTTDLKVLTGMLYQDHVISNVISCSCPHLENSKLRK
ncbi:structural maintenance of chromosomes protein 2 [Tanacetum coccineum]